jgi:hypothetical protein
MRRLGRWLRRGFTAIGVVAFLVIAALILVGNPVSGGDSSGSAISGGGNEGDSAEDKHELTLRERNGYDNDSRTIAERRDDARLAAEAYAEYEAMQTGPRATQAKLDRLLLKKIVGARALLDRCGRENAYYGKFDFSSCGGIVSDPALSIVVVADGYEISGSAGGATFTDHMQLLIHRNSCDQPEVGACSAAGTWSLI